MPDIEIWRIFVTLGVPGLALGVLYMLFRRMNWKLTTVPRKWMGPLALLFLLAATGIVAYTLSLWAPGNKKVASQETSGPGQAPALLSNAPSPVPRDEASKGSILGAYKSRELGVVVVLRAPGGQLEPVDLTIEDVYFCLTWAKKNPQEDMGVTFDADPSHDGMFAVRYHGGLSNTHLGYLLYRADYALKEYLLGHHLDGKELHSAVTVYPTLLKILREGIAEGTAIYGHFWFVAAPHLTVDSTKRVALVRSPGVELRFDRVVGAEAPVQHKYFAEGFTMHFPRFARENKALKAFVDIVQLVALARWLADTIPGEGVTWLEQHIGADYPTPERLPVVRMRKSKPVTSSAGSEVRKATLTVEGGVWIPAKSDSTMTTDPSLDVLAREIEALLRQHPSEQPIQVRHGNRTLDGYIIELSSEADAAIRRIP